MVLLVTLPEATPIHEAMHLERARLGGHYAHVNDEAISPKHDDAAGEVWLHGRFAYILYRRPAGT